MPYNEGMWLSQLAIGLRHGLQHPKLAQHGSITKLVGDKKLRQIMHFRLFAIASNFEEAIFL